MKQMLINVEEHEIRIAILEDDILTELFVENQEDPTVVGNVYKGTVVDIKPGIQAAFVDIGVSPKNAYLHFDDIKFEACRHLVDKDFKAKWRANQKKRKGGKFRARFPSAEEYLKTGMELNLQVLKDPISTKSCRVTTNVSLPGRYLVLLPFASQSAGGVSRKIEDYGERRRLKRILEDIQEDERYIVRTSGIDRDQDEIGKDVEFLNKTWASVKRKAARAKAPALLLNDHEIVSRVVRDIVQPDMDEIWIDSRAECTALRRTIGKMIPGMEERVHHYKGLIGLFDHYDVERQIVKALRRKVWLRSGGNMIFDEMEAMTAIDVNTGKFTGSKSQKDIILKTNLEAARMVARQLRLRDIGGLIVIDFIDMESPQDRKQLLQEFNAHLKSDRAKHSVTSISEFGLVEMTRKRVRGSLQKYFFTECPHCLGTGMTLTEQQVWRAVKRAIATRLENAPRPDLTVRVAPGQKNYIEANHHDEINKWCSRYRIEIQLLDWKELQPDEFEIATRPKAVGKAKAAAGQTERLTAWNPDGDSPPSKSGGKRSAKPDAPKPVAPKPAGPSEKPKPAAESKQRPADKSKRRQKSTPAGKPLASAPAAEKDAPAKPEAAPAAPTADATASPISASARRRARRARAKAAKRVEQGAVAPPADATSTADAAPTPEGAPAVEAPPAEQHPKKKRSQRADRARSDRSAHAAPETRNPVKDQPSEKAPPPAPAAAEAPRSETPPLAAGQELPKKRKRRGRRGGRRHRQAAERRALREVAVVAGDKPTAAQEHPKPEPPAPAAASEVQTEQRPPRQRRARGGSRIRKAAPSTPERAAKAERKEAPPAPAAAPKKEKPASKAAPKKAAKKAAPAKAAKKKAAKESKAVVAKKSSVKRTAAKAAKPAAARKTTKKAVKGAVKKTATKSAAKKTEKAKAAPAKKAAVREKAAAKKTTKPQKKTPAKRKAAAKKK